ncbi:MAG: methyl-accepting chemotaxis protein [Desulfococcaceae bacterium]
MLSFLSFRDIPVRIKFLTAYSLLFTLALGLGTLTIWHYVKKSVEMNAEGEMENVTQTIRNMVEATANVSIQKHLKSIAEANRNMVETLHMKIADRSLAAGSDYRFMEEMIISEDSARRLMEDILMRQTIGKTGYMYCISSKGVLEVHPKDALRGSDLSGYDFVQKQIQMKEGYIEYDWKNPGEDKERHKALYMTYFKPWDWIISASSYREEFVEMISPEEFSEKILSIRIGTSGYPYIMDTGGNVIIHPEIAGSNILESKDADGRYFIREVCEKKSGKIRYPWKNPGESKPRVKWIVFDYIPEFDWIVASSAYEDEFYAPLKTLGNIIIFTILGTLLLMIPLTLFVTSRILNPLTRASEAARSLARFDLSVRVESEGKDETGLLLESVKLMIESLREVISSIAETAGKVDHSAEKISQTMSEQAAVSIQQSAAVSEISSTMEEFSATSAQIAENANSVTQIANQTLKSTKEGVNSIEEVMRKMDRISGDNQNNTREITALSAKTDEITNIMGLINNIADQTRLIAFNASIEAAGAGEKGRRFGVVAAEIRRLADSVTESTDEIEARISEIREAVNRMVIASEVSTKGILEGAELFTHTVQRLNEILNGAQSTTDAARQISLSTQQQKSATDQIVVSLKDIATGAGQTSSAITHISGVSRDLKNLSGELRTMISRFILSGNPGPAEAGDRQVSDSVLFRQSK